MKLPNWRLSGLSNKSGFMPCVPLLAMLLLAPCAYAAPPTPSFSMLGYLQQLKLDNPSNPLSSGSMVVNGVNVILPNNLLIKMPGQYLTVNDLFRGPHPGLAPTLALVLASSGLALNDVPKPAIPFEVQVIGNMVGNNYVAGWVNITQQDLNMGAGFIRSIDYAKGELSIGATTGPTIARVRINDPAGRYGKKNADKTGGDRFDERFASDPGNAPVVSATGFPMCIPRSLANDPDCPLVNRAPAPNQNRFTCGASTNDPTAPVHAACQPGKPAPLQVGDYITYAGMLTEDTPRSGTFFHAAHAIGAMTGIYTSPGTDPAYVFIEVSILGSLGAPYPGVLQEATSRYKIVGFTTDPSRQVDAFLMDVPGERRVTTLLPSTVPPIGRFRITLPSKSNFLPVTRDVRVRIKGHTSTPVAGGLDSGQYTAPVSEYIYPENTLFGNPVSPVSVPFENFCFLSKADGLLGTLGRDKLPNVQRPPIGPLSPFPASGNANPQTMANGSNVCP